MTPEADRRHKPPVTSRGRAARTGYGGINLADRHEDLTGVRLAELRTVWHAGAAVQYVDRTRVWIAAVVAQTASTVLTRDDHFRLIDRVSVEVL